MTRESRPEVLTRKSPDRNVKLGYDTVFREMLRKYPGVVKIAIGLADKAADEYSPGVVKFGSLDFEYDKEKRQWFERRTGISGKPLSTKPMSLGRGMILAPGKTLRDEKSGLEIIMLGRSNREIKLEQFTRTDVSDYYKLNLGSQSFFVKRSWITASAGFSEFQDTLKAKMVLQDLDFVKVVEAKLGYQDRSESWYISKWEDLEKAGFGHYNRSVDDYGEKIEASQGTHTKGIQEKVNLIREKLRRANIDRDVINNLFYNPQTEKFVLLNVTGYGKEKMLGSAIKN